MDLIEIGFIIIKIISSLLHDHLNLPWNPLPLHQIQPPQQFYQLIKMKKSLFSIPLNHTNLTLLMATL